MDRTDLSPRTVGLVALAALVPVVVYAVTLSRPFAGVVTALNVLLIAYALWTLATPVEGGHTEEAGTHR